MQAYKPRHIERLLRAFPARRFWLVGDSGEVCTSLPARARPPPGPLHA
jgi:phosphatidate phosphatase APP1